MYNIYLLSFKYTTDLLDTIYYKLVYIETANDIEEAKQKLIESIDVDIWDIQNCTI